MSRWALILVLTVGCSKGGAQPGRSDQDGGGSDAHVSVPTDLNEEVPDLTGVTGDLAFADLRPAADLRVPPDLAQPPDLRAPADLSPPPDLAVSVNQSVDIYVDNTCKMDVVPKKFDIPAGSSLKLTYFNRSRDYSVDVWLSYGGGFLDLKTGTSWADRFEFCRNPRPYTAYADISTACSRYRLLINCL